MRTTSLSDAQAHADKTGGHVECVHFMDRYEYEVKKGPDPRAWVERVQKGEKS